MCIRDRIPNLPAKVGLEGGRGRDIANSRAPIRNPPIRNPRNPWRLAREEPGRPLPNSDPLVVF
eukprot:26813-Alexandrium_andersonii.AAC.1